MTSYTSYQTLNSLSEFSLIAGTEFTLNFTVYDSDGVTPLDISSGTIKWVLCPFGQTDYTVLQKSGTVTGANTFSVYLTTADTESLSGKYIHQPIIIDFLGSEFRPSQGVVLILPQIPAT